METNRVIKLVDQWGRTNYVRQHGRMNITQHKKVLSALEERALRYRKKGQLYDYDDRLYYDALDETGTVSTADRTDPDSKTWVNEDPRSIEITEQLEMMEAKGIAHEVLQVHGVAPGRKPEGCTRMILENPNGINTRMAGNEKLNKAKEIIDELEADIVAHSEHRVNCRHKDNKNGFGQMFRGGESKIRTIVGHNVHENVSRTQEGGVSLLLFGTLIQQYDFEHSGKDETGLGRWVSMLFQGENEIATRVVCGYNPCYNKNGGSRTTYQQHRRYFIRKEKDDTCPRRRFREDLEKQLKSWRESGERLIVCMDANEHIYEKSIGKMLTNEDGLAMREVVGDFTGKRLGATFFRGTTPIDGVWATPDVEVVGACVMPCGYGIGDHRLFCVDFRTSSLVGAEPPRVIRAAARRLNTEIPRVENKYTDNLEANFARHRIIERTVEAQRSSKSKSEVKRRLDNIDVEARQYMAHSEKKCRRIKSGRIPFSPDSAMWIRRSQVYRSLLRLRANKIRNRGNLKRSARRCGIVNPLKLPLDEIRARLKVCKEKLEYFAKHGHRSRRKHLNNRLKAARQRKDEDAEARILAILEREKSKAYWRRLNYSMAKAKGRSVRTVQTSTEDGEVTEHCTQESVQHAIWNEIHGQRFYLAEQAPICQGRLRGEFGYKAFSPTAKSILDGRHVFPPDFDPATKELLEECARIRNKVPANSVSPDINCAQWQYKWCKARERTSSSESGLHFGHYKAGASSDMILEFHALKTTLALRLGIALARWSRGLSVMLEKMFGCTLVTKLRAILLMEADFNAANKIVFGERMMDVVRHHGCMPEEIFSDKGKMADDGSLAKVLFYDIVRQGRISAGLSSIDAANCYDSVAHAVASMVFQAFGVPDEAIDSMLTAIQEMKYFLRTAYGDSKEFVGSSIEVKFQGLCQGNGAAPAGWAVISITIIGAHKRKGHGGFFVCPISKLTGDLAAIIFVDDTDLIHIRMDKEETPTEAHSALQDSIINWGLLLIASGGAFKPVKCFSHLISFEWTPDGRWKYSSNESKEEFDVAVPMPDGSSVTIDNLSVDTAKETLGVWTCPSGKADESIKVIQKKAQEWIDRAKEGKLKRRDVWFLLKHQLWPRLKYGLCSSTASYTQLTHCLKKQWWQLLPLGGIIRTARTPIRQTSHGFYGAGCPHPGVEACIEQINKLLMHFGCPSSTGLKMKASLEFLTVELGVSPQPLQESYQRYGKWATPSWFKTLWEKCDKLNMRVEFNEDILTLPRVGDKWLMLEFGKLGYSGVELERLNRVRIHQQVLFLSCVLGATGKELDERCLVKRRPDQKWSTIKFPNEKPPRKDFTLWRNALCQLVPAYGIQDRLGPLTHPGYKIWDWTINEISGRLYHHSSDGISEYRQSRQARYANRANRWERVAAADPAAAVGKICTVKTISESIVSVASMANPCPQPQPKSDFLEVLLEWGNTWIWDNIIVQGNVSWPIQSIADKSVVAVTDGSYLKEEYPGVSSAAFVLECKNGRGRIVGSFAEQSSSACAYRGELMGLMALHLVLLAVNKIEPNLKGSVSIVSDCLGALTRVAHLPPTRIPSCCKHSDILKNIMINCQSISFDLTYHHVEAHQDEGRAFHSLPHVAQLNCRMDAEAKEKIYTLDSEFLPVQEPFPLEPVAVFAGKEKMTSSTSDSLRFWAHLQLAQETYHELGLLYNNQFQQVDWPSVYHALHEVPRMFAVWACKQVMEVAPTNLNRHKYDNSHDPTCPSCGTAPESCAHVLHCEEAGRVEALLRSIGNLDIWLEEADTEPTLRRTIIEFAKARDGRSMADLVRGEDARFGRLAASQDLIGWRRLMEGMISKEAVKIQQAYYCTQGGRYSPKAWARTLVTKLLEVSHGQWLYRNVQVHDTTDGLLATQRKEELQKAIEDQLSLGGEGLAEEDKYLLEINLEDLETTSGETQTYWLLALMAAREAVSLRRQRTAAAASNT